MRKASGCRDYAAWTNRWQLSRTSTRGQPLSCGTRRESPGSYGTRHAEVVPTRKSICPPRAHSAASSERRSPANSSGPSEDGDVVAALRGLRVGAAAPAVSSQLRSHRRPQGSGYQASRSAQEIVIQHVALFASARVSHSILPGVSVPPQESGTICSTM